MFREGFPNTNQDGENSADDIEKMQKIADDTSQRLSAVHINAIHEKNIIDQEKTNKERAARLDQYHNGATGELEEEHPDISGVTVKTFAAAPELETRGNNDEPDFEALVDEREALDIEDGSEYTEQELADKTLVTEQLAADKKLVNDQQVADEALVSNAQKTVQDYINKRFADKPGLSEGDLVKASETIVAAEAAVEKIPLSEKLRSSWNKWKMRAKNAAIIAVAVTAWHITGETPLNVELSPISGVSVEEMAQVGEGVTQVLKRALDSDAEVAAELGYDGSMESLADIARGFDYQVGDGNDTPVYATVNDMVPAFQLVKGPDGRTGVQEILVDVSSGEIIKGAFRN